MSRKIQLPRFTKKEYEDIQLGLEVECYVKNEHWHEFRNEMRKLWKTKHKN